METVLLALVWVIRCVAWTFWAMVALIAFAWLLGYGLQLWQKYKLARIRTKLDRAQNELNHKVAELDDRLAAGRVRASQLMHRAAGDLLVERIKRDM